MGLDSDFADALTAAKCGDEGAFVQIFRSVQPQLLRLLRALARDLAEDLASETWLQVVRGLAGFEGDEPSFRAWVFSIARARRIDRLCADGRRPSVVDIDSLDRADLPGHADVAEAVERRTSTQEALRLIATLPGDQAEVILLRVVAGLDVAHTARVVGRHPGTVRVLTPWFAAAGPAADPTGWESRHPAVQADRTGL